MVSNKLLYEFKQIMKEEYDLELSDEEAIDIANGIVDFFQIIQDVLTENVEEHDRCPELKEF